MTKLDAATKANWEKAQEAEKGHWAWLWQAADSEERRQLINGETIKGEFIFQEMVEHFGIKPKTDWAKKNILDVGCGPLSIVARHGLGKTRSGVDPLRYPTWVYDDYDAQDFKVFMTPFEELDTKQKYDVIIFYNALQHFADLKLVAQTCKDLLAKNGKVYLSEYLKVPTNDAHIQFLEKDTLDRHFESTGLSVDSVIKSVRLPGYVERPDGSAIDLYIARLKLNNG